MFDLVWRVVGSLPFSAENIPVYAYGIVRNGYFLRRKCGHMCNYSADFSPIVSGKLWDHALNSTCWISYDYSREKGDAVLAKITRDS